MIEWVDAQVTWLQRRYGFNIISSKAHLSILAFFAAIINANMMTTGRTIFIIINGVVFGFVAWYRTVEAKNLADYPEDARKTMRINAIALAHRESTFHTFLRSFCVVWFCVAISELLFKQNMQNFSGLVLWTGILSVTFLDACFAMGPGEHGKDKKKVLSADMVPETEV